MRRRRPGAGGAASEVDAHAVTLEVTAADTGDGPLIDRIRAERLTYLSPTKLAWLASSARAVEAAGLDGMILEAGCALGGSTVLLASTKSPDRPLRVYDVFGMIPPPTDEDTPDVHARYATIAAGESEGIDGDRYYGYEEDLLGVVVANLARFGITPADDHVELIPGLLQDTMTVDGPVALAHVDVDWYDPVTTCLERLWPRLVVGGRIVLDDYHDWGGCRKATDEYLAGIAGGFDLDDTAGSMTITRTA